MTGFTYRDGVLHAEALPLTMIAEHLGTPCYVYAQGAIEANARAFREGVAAMGDPWIAYAMKANPNAAVLATMARLGFGADVVSGGELKRAVAAGIPPGQIVFSGVGKTAAEMVLALDMGIGQFNLESEPEARLLSEVALARGQRAPVALRVNPDVDAGTHAKITTGLADTKFGVSMADAELIFAQSETLPGLRFQGITTHIGSQLTRLTPLMDAFTGVGGLLARLRAAGHRIDTVDFGGGLGIVYDPEAPPPPSAADYGAMIARIAGSWDVRAIFEPGRALVGTAGLLLTRVIRVKTGTKNPWVIVDAGMNDLIRPSLYDAWHDIVAVQPDGAHFTANVVGPVCESGDTFATARMMDRVAAGDLVAFMGCGAYAATMASTYNSRCLTPEVMVRHDAMAVVRPRLSIEQLMTTEQLPPWFSEERA